MKKSEIKIGDKIIENNLFLAPIAGYTNFAFRKNILPFNVGFCYTELVSAKGLFFGGKSNQQLLDASDYNKTGAQIFGSEPYYLRKACESDYLKNYQIVDINMGCPVPKVFKNGEGSALLRDVNLAESCISECVKSGKIITVKIRTGLKYGDDIASEYAKMAENAGASLITIHGRVREAYYSGEVDYKAIENAKKSVKIPVIANGGIFTKEDADNLIDRTGADGVMIARGAIQNPFIFNQILNVDTKTSIKDFAIAFLRDFVTHYGEKRACVEFRKYATYFYKNQINGKSARLKICQTESFDEIKKILENTL